MKKFISTIAVRLMTVVSIVAVLYGNDTAIKLAVGYQGVFSTIGLAFTLFMFAGIILILGAEKKLPYTPTTSSRIVMVGTQLVNAVTVTVFITAGHTFIGALMLVELVLVLIMTVFVEAVHVKTRTA